MVKALQSFVGDGPRGGGAIPKVHAEVLEHMVRSPFSEGILLGTRDELHVAAAECVVLGCGKTFRLGEQHPVFLCPGPLAHHAATAQQYVVFCLVSVLRRARRDGGAEADAAALQLLIAEVTR